jgi:hypothetical protein
MSSPNITPSDAELRSAAASEVRGRVQQYFASLAVFALCVFSSGALAQTKTPYHIHVDSNMLQAPIRSESNLVLVPVFVFDRTAMLKVTPPEWQCAAAQNSAFYNLLPSEPFQPKECSHAGLRGLTVKDFRILQDDVEQKIQQVAAEGWMEAARDNMVWHLETSLTPVGIWASTDLGGVMRPTVGREFYNLAYVPSGSAPGCHSIIVTVGRPNSVVYARDQYCTGQSMSDLLYGTQDGSKLEKDLTSGKKGKLHLSMQVGYFHMDSRLARVQVALEFSYKSLYHVWDPATGSLFARIGVLGMAYREDGSLAARFSDLLYPHYWPTFVEGGQTAPALLAAHDSNGPNGDEPSLAQHVVAVLEGKDLAWLPARYETQFILPAGDYDLRVVLNDTQEFGTDEVPLHIDNYDGQTLTLSSVVLCKRYRDAHVAAVERAAANFAPQYVPLVSKGIEFTPTGDTRFKKGEPLIPYFEVYEPLLASQPETKVEAHIRILDAKTGKVIKDFPPIDAASYENPGSATIPMAREIPHDKLPKGAYRLEVQAKDSAGKSSAIRTAEFMIE